MSMGVMIAMIMMIMMMKVSVMVVFLKMMIMMMLSGGGVDGNMKHKGAIVQRVSISRSKRGAVNIVRADKTKSAHFKVTLLDISASLQW